MSLTQSSMATDSWGASADKAQTPCSGSGGSLASKQRTGPHWSWFCPVDGPGLWSEPLPQLPEGSPRHRGILFSAVTADQALFR